MLIGSNGTGGRSKRSETGRAAGGKAAPGSRQQRAGLWDPWPCRSRASAALRLNHLTLSFLLLARYECSPLLWLQVIIRRSTWLRIAYPRDPQMKRGVKAPRVPVFPLPRVVRERVTVQKHGIGCSPQNA